MKDGEVWFCWLETRTCEIVPQKLWGFITGKDKTKILESHKLGHDEIELSLDALSKKYPQEISLRRGVD